MERHTLNHDTICAISTPPGAGGIAVIRISGPQAIAITDRHWKGTPLDTATTHTAHLGWLVDAEGHRLDQCLATIFRSPHSYTGDNTVEISIHGSIWLQQEIINLLINSGCRLAEPGEYTRRAFSAGNLDLTQAEAVADLIAARSKAAHRIALSQMRGNFSTRITRLRDNLINLASLIELELDFSEEDVQFVPRDKLTTLATDLLNEITRLTSTFATGQALRDGIPTAIIGHPNAGKSTLLNLLLDDNRAIVSDIPGTTRDTIEDTTQIDGKPFRFIDTAGLRQTTDTIENLGIQRTISTIKRARIILWLIDAVNPGDIDATATLLQQNTTDQTTIIPIITKADIATPDHIATIHHHPAITRLTISPIHLASPTRQGLDLIINTLNTAIPPVDDNTTLITNARHYQALNLATADLTRLIQALNANIPTDLVAQDLRQALHHIATITGTITTPDILASIFSRFCIGK